jgi:hypothetical protein
MPFNLERSTVNVKDLINKIQYDTSNPVLFVINKRSYNFFEVFADKNLLSVEVNNIKIEARLSQMTQDDVVKVINKEDISSEMFDILIPTNSHFYMIVITIT